MEKDRMSLLFVIFFIIRLSVVLYPTVLYALWDQYPPVSYERRAYGRE